MNKHFLRENKSLIRQIWALSLPTILEQFLQTVVSYADTAQVGRIGAAASAAVGLTASTVWLINAPFFAAGMAFVAIISQAFGAKDLDAVKKAVMQTMLVTVGLGLSVGILTCSISQVLPVWLGAAPEIRQDAAAYLLIICTPMLFRAAGILFGAVLRASGDTKTPLLYNTIMNGVNILLNYLLINPTHTVSVGRISFRMWGADLGVRGAAIATAIALTVGGTLMFIAVLKNSVLSFVGQPVTFHRPTMERCFRIAAPIAGQRIVVCLGHVFFTSLVSRLGTVAVAAHAIALTAEQAFYVPGYGMQAAAATLAGNAVGEQNEKKLSRVSLLVLLISVSLISVCSLLLFLFPRAIMHLFTQEEAVLSMGAAVLRLVAFSEPMFAAMVILEGVFDGVGDTKMPFLISAVSMWGVRIVSAAFCVSVLHLGLSAVWLCMIADNVCRCILLGARYHRGRWKTGLFPSRSASADSV